MARTPSKMIPLGTPLPSFHLLDTTTGSTFDSTLLTDPVCVLWLSVHCPYVKHVASELPTIAMHLEERGVRVVAICSNDAEAYPDDSPENMAKEAADRGYPFPFLYDETQEVAEAFGAACTPDVFLFDASHHLAYRGQLDGARPSNDVPVTGVDVIAAADALPGRLETQLASLGCNIKWKNAA